MGLKKLCLYGFGIIAVILSVLFLNVNTCDSARNKSDEVMTKQSLANLTAEQLQSTVISFANRFIATIGQAALTFENKIPTPEARLNAARRKVYSISAVTEIAAGPNPGAALMDMVVMVTLNRMVWEEHWRPVVFGMDAEIMIHAFKKMEEDIWSIVAQILTPVQIEELREVIMDWYNNHSGQIDVDYIRLSDFGDLGRKPELKKIKVKGGFLAPVEGAKLAIDEIRKTSERAIFLLTKMQLILGFQTELVYKELVMQPEVTKILNDISGFKETAEKFSTLAENFPEEVAKLQTDAINQFMEELNQERKAAIGDISQLVERERSALLKNTQDFERLAATTERVGLVFNELVNSVDKLAIRFESKEPSKPFDIEDYTAALSELKVVAQELDKLAHSINQDMDSKIFGGIVTKFNEAAEKRIDHIFWRLALLIVILCMCVVIILVIHRLLSKQSLSKV
jgi:hypothetical protein